MTPVTDLKESSVTNNLTSVMSVTVNPHIPIFSRFHRPEWNLWAEDDAEDAGDRLEDELEPNQKMRCLCFR